MPIVDENRIIGNFGSNLVAYTLSKICLVRPVAEGTDIGIDLYCESIEEGQGFLHFWAQVKCGTQIKLKKNGKASCKFETEHLRYWNRQPVPVLGFYVNTKFPPEPPEHIFIANISEHLIINGIPDSKHKVIESQFKISLKSDDWHNDFISRLKSASTLVKLRDDGIVSSIPELNPAYIRQYQQRYGISSYAKKSLRTIRSTVSSLILDAALLKHHEDINPPNNFFDPLISILKIFEVGKRPEIMKALALWAAIIERDVERAKNFIDIAIQSICGDRNVNESIRKTWIQEFDPIKGIIGKVEANQCEITYQRH
jgi:hypothetical protein